MSGLVTPYDFQRTSNTDLTTPSHQSEQSSLYGSKILNDDSNHHTNNNNNNNNMEEYYYHQNNHSFHNNNSTFNSEDGAESYMGSSIVTSSAYPYPDATQHVHEKYLVLLYLLSNPEEFKKILEDPSSSMNNHHQGNNRTLSDWNQDYTDAGSTIGGSTYYTTKNNGDESEGSIPLPYVVFCDDAEVVLPQAHTASQLFGVERLEGIELEAAAGMHSVSQLFLRWLALMPGGDHLNIIDPPGLTVMRIAGGRYRVTAAHRVVWTWMNEFAELDVEQPNDVPLSKSNSNEENMNYYNNTNINTSYSDISVKTNNNTTKKDKKLKVGDLVTMTIVDVFETDNHGKLLSYCPTFDNRDITKTSVTSETLKKSSSKLASKINIMANSKAANKINDIAKRGLFAGYNAATSFASNVVTKNNIERFRFTNKNNNSYGDSPTKKRLMNHNSNIDDNASSTTTPSMTHTQDFRVMTKAEQAIATANNGQNFIYQENDDESDFDGPYEI